MNYLVEYEPEALADLEKLTKAVSGRIVNKINWLADNFDQITPQPLTADLSGFFKLRVGDYRVIYEFDLDKKTIFIDRVGHRREIYN
ncbi:MULTISPECIES: type II toxin-antitoxin system RelE/ParE family toxin [unclassified Nostoc]|uniref:type II toxin-antitoxin system RelE family toxin n=1 Tax=unclassified Nostoc TaxID=2593658 RepID=UPI002AD42392|nr:MULTISPECIES: type II toxin-antitoxin system RelE/ParE family toxin [unclassified Nostoc]MDZ8125179.1 type II toxin-antitoxin system RelE/ParE family toxin [Nostoc sp. CmiVER01]MDZ8226649.1 type II toxin-antitoxin system RelE/ParE family toxin [Nostoc sp. ChiVER01]